MISKLREEDIKRLSFRHYEEASYLKSALDCNNLHHYFDALKEHDVIELGPGNNPVKKHFACKSYATSHGYYPRDGLSILRKVENSSVVVVSFGVMDDTILLPFQGNKQLRLNYIHELVEEIIRVTNPFSIIFGLDAEKYMGAPKIPAIDCEARYGGVYLF